LHDISAVRLYITYPSSFLTLLILRHAQGHVECNFMRRNNKTNEEEDRIICMRFLTQAQVVSKPLCRNLAFHFIDIFYGHHSLSL